MPDITIRLHRDLAERLLEAGPDGARALAALWRQAGSAVRTHGRHIAYAPAVLPNGLHCAMSVHVGLRGMVVEVDGPGTLIPDAASSWTASNRSAGRRVGGSRNGFPGLGALVLNCAPGRITTPKGGTMNDIVRILKAADFAARKHANQRRKGDLAEPYLNHLIEVAGLVAEATGGRADAVVAALLHDAVEDQGVAIGEIAELFGASVAALVAEVTDDKTLPKQERKDWQVASAPHKSDDASVIKLADKTSNLRAIASSPPPWPVERKRDYVRWARSVVAGLPCKPAALLALFEEAAKLATDSIDRVRLPLPRPLPDERREIARTGLHPRSPGFRARFPRACRKSAPAMRSRIPKLGAARLCCGQHILHALGRPSQSRGVLGQGGARYRTASLGRARFSTHLFPGRHPPVPWAPTTPTSPALAGPIV